jgi:hypothetical protein
VHLYKCTSACRIKRQYKNKKRTETRMLYCYVYQFNTGDEDDEKAGSNEYNINKRTKEQHSAEFCLSHRSSMKDKEKEKKKKKKEDTDDQRLQGRSFTNSL